MKITNNGISQTSLTPAQQTPDAVSAGRDASGAAPTSDSDVYTPSAEWLRLVDLARKEPEIREGRVREVLDRLESGTYLDAASAAKTADAILVSLD